MNKREALERIAAAATYCVAPLYAEALAKAFERTLDKIGCVPTPLALLVERRTQYERSASVIAEKHREDVAVAMDDFAARLAVNFGLYASLDHAMQAPAMDRQSDTFRYVVGRAVLRLTRLFYGDMGVWDFRERHPEFPREVFVEKLYLPYGARP